MYTRYACLMALFFAGTTAFGQAVEPNSVERAISLLTPPKASRLDSSEVRNALDPVSDPDVVRVLRQLAMKEAEFLQTGVLHSYLGHRWSDAAPLSPIGGEIEDRSSPPVLRLFLLRLLDHLLIRERQAAADPEVTLGFISVLERVASDREDAAVRAEAVALEARLLLGLADFTERQKREGLILRLLADPSEAPLVRARAAEAATELAINEARGPLRGVLERFSEEPTLVVQASMVSLAKVKDGPSLPLIARVGEGTHEAAAHRTALYSLSLYADPAALKLALPIFDRYGHRPGALLLQRFQPHLTRVLNSRQREFFLTALRTIQAARLASFADAALELIDDSDPDIRLAAAEAVLAVGSEQELMEAARKLENEQQPALQPIRQRLLERVHRTSLREQVIRQRHERGSSRPEQ